MCDAGSTDYRRNTRLSLRYYLFRLVPRVLQVIHVVPQKTIHFGQLLQGWAGRFHDGVPEGQVLCSQPMWFLKRVRKVMF